MGAILQCTADAEDEIKSKADKTNSILTELIQGTQEELDMAAVLTHLTRQLSNKFEPTRLAVLRWLGMLMVTRAATLCQPAHLALLFPPLLTALSDLSEPVVRYACVRVCMCACVCACVRALQELCGCVIVVLALVLALVLVLRVLVVCVSFVLSPFAFSLTSSGCMHSGWTWRCWPGLPATTNTLTPC